MRDRAFLVLMLLLARSDAVGEHRSGWLSTALVTAATVIMTVLPAWYLLA